ncbi:choice-of-anchor Q domain-containing protein [Flavobacterium selenitireducens]|uniref:choice-of-anchor Q domain-containing protein n=1 Tax=Flavobacterium selenitireducens TaxID=2722704 RepID=UPI00168AABA1|nr:choice-of-anchor Q domain-containing protein [Flavobacterium selenitireducens]MBD3583920.1 hypothetical protein [Flavobacterium selenitireducens]
MKKLLFLAIFFSTTYYSHATRFYVNSAATGSNNGLSWTNAYTNLQSAFSNVIFGDEIWVAAGTYFPTATTTKTISFVLKDGVNVYGGFNGTETLLSQRDILAAPTTLSGDIGALGEYLDNSYNVVRANNLTSTIYLDGFRILNGYANGTIRGGGLLISQSTAGNLIVKNCLFFSNRALNYGGAIGMFNARLTIENCDFRNNYGPGSGGAIYSETSGAENDLYISNSRFIGNSGDQGACIGVGGNFDEIIIDRCVFTNNTGGNYIIEVDGFNFGRIFNSLFVGNNLDEGSGNVVYINEAQNITTEDFEMINTTIANNINTYQFGISGEMVFLDKPYYKIYNSIIFGNTPYQGRQVNPDRIIKNSIIQGGYSSGINILDLDPLFVNPNNNYSEAFDAALFDYHLQSSSPAQNAGNNMYVNASYNFDLDGNSRIDQSIVDLGAYESSFLKIDSIINATSAFQYINSENKIYITDSEFSFNQKLSIFSATGSLIKTIIIDSEQIQLTLQPGIYFLKIRENVGKILVQ